jgi:hypothetical protein
VRRPALLGAALVAVAVVTVATVLITHNAGQAKAADAAAPNPNCTLVVPANPLTAQGLATPYQLVATDPAGGPCNEANVAQSAFVEAAILTANGQLATYDPLVIDKGTQPAAPTVPAQVADGSTVGIWFGFNGTNLTLQAANGTDSLNQGNCVNGLPGGTIFGQFSYCNAPAFFQSANTAIGNNQLQVPAQAMAKDGMPCPTTRDFSLVDQDQSDNVVTHYLATANGQTAQKNAANTAKLAGAVDLANGSDNLLLSQFVDPALGCTPWMTPDQSSDGNPTAALATDELSAAADQKAPIALVPLNDPMTLDNNNTSTTKTNLYRQGVDQGTIGGGGDNGDGATYCTNLFTNAAGIQRVFQDQAMFANAPSVDAAMASNLFTFLAMRAQASFGNLNCQGMNNPITLTMNNNIVTAATFTAGGAPAPAPTSTAGAGPTAPSATSSSGAPAPTSSTAASPPSSSAGAGPPSSSAGAGPPATGTASPTTTNGGHHHHG